jgi:hypothetical protein
MHYYCSDASIIYAFCFTTNHVAAVKHIARRVLILVAPYTREMGQLATAEGLISRGKSVDPEDDVVYFCLS